MGTAIGDLNQMDLLTFTGVESSALAIPSPEDFDAIIALLENFGRDYDILVEPLGMKLSFHCEETV